MERGKEKQSTDGKIEIPREGIPQAWADKNQKRTDAASRIGYQDDKETIMTWNGTAIHDNWRAWRNGGAT